MKYLLVTASTIAMLVWASTAKADPEYSAPIDAGHAIVHGIIGQGHHDHGRHYGPRHREHHYVLRHREHHYVLRHRGHHYGYQHHDVDQPEVIESAPQYYNNYVDPHSDYEEHHFDD